MLTDGLTPRQREIHDLLEKGLSVRQVAHLLNVTTQRIYEVKAIIRDRTAGTASSGGVGA